MLPCGRSTGGGVQHVWSLEGARPPRTAVYPVVRMSVQAWTSHWWSALLPVLLERLLECMGYSLEVIRRPVQPELTRSERRSWMLHRQLSRHLSPESLMEWTPRIHSNLDRLRSGVIGQPHTRNVERWRDLVDRGDVPGIRRVLTGLDRDSIEMREVSPLGGLVGQDERDRVMASL